MRLGAHVPRMLHSLLVKGKKNPLHLVLHQLEFRFAGTELTLPGLSKWVYYMKIKNLRNFHRGQENKFGGFAR